jgi:hypothetical protein
MVQEIWRAKHQEHWLQHVRNMGLTGMPDSVPTWWSVSRQHQVLTDRRKMQAIILDFFAVFIEPQLDNDLAAMCKHLCAGISIEETFKIADMCSVWSGDDRRNAAV